MKAYLKYELKKAILPTIIFTAIVFALCFSSFNSETLSLRFYGVVTVEIFLILLCFITPAINFVFKNKMRETDLWFSMPIKREKLYGVKAIVGLTETLVPYTAAYWVAFIIQAIYEINAQDSTITIHMGYLVPLYFISVVVAVGLFGINAFALSRANNFVDGGFNIAFIMPFFASVLLVISIILMRFENFSFVDNVLFGFTLSPIITVIIKYVSLASNGTNVFAGINGYWIMMCVYLIVSMAAWAGLIFGARYVKAENSERSSNSWFGHKFFLPFYNGITVMIIGMAFGKGIGAVGFLLVYVLVNTFIGYFILRRKFKLKKQDLVAIAISVLVGLIAGILLSPI